MKPPTGVSTPLTQNESKLAILASIIETSDDAILTFSLDGEITSWNPAAERMYGYSADEVIGQNFSVFLPPGATDESANIVQTILDGQQVERYETVRVRKDSTTLHISLTVSPIHDSTGTIIGASSISRDMTGQMQASKYARDILESAPDAMIIVDTTGSIVIVNAQTEKLFRYHRDEILGRPVEMLIPNGFHSKHVDFRDGFFAESEARPMGVGIEIYGLRKDGWEFPAEISLSPIETEKGLLVAAAIRDVTAQKEASSFARSLIEASLDPMVMISLDGKITDLNQGSANVTGVAREVLIGADFSDYFTEPEVARESFKKVFTEGPVTNYPLTIRHVDGTLTDVLYNASIYRDTAGHALGVFAAARDVTDLKEMIRRLEVMNDLRNEFVAIVAHDLRSPMTSISGFAHMLTDHWDTTDDAKKIEYLEIIARNTDDLAEFVEDVLQVARIEAGEFTYDICPFDIRLLIKKAIDEASGANNERQFEFVALGDIPFVLGDEDRQWQVLTNLLSNAVKFSPADKAVAVELSCDGDSVQVSITDHGIGITKQNLSKLFQKFGRVSKIGGRKVPGNGLGLYICKTLVEAQNGRLWCESRPGRGSTFIYTIPVAR